MVWNCREISSSMTHKGGLMSDTGKVNEDIPPKRSMTDDEIMQFLQRKRRQLHKRIALLEKRIARIEGYLERRCLE